VAERKQKRPRAPGQSSRGSGASGRDPGRRNYGAIGHQYARDVVAGKIPAAKWQRLGCKRHLDDLARERNPDFPFKFDAKKAATTCRFIELLPHVKGKWARAEHGQAQRMILEPSQIFEVASLFGWVDKVTGLRRFRRAYLKKARKNGKSPLAAAIGLFMLAADGEPGAEVYCGATTQDQAWEVFRPARLMALKTPELQQYFGVTVNAKTLVIEEDFSRFEPVIGKPGDGAMPSCSITDEYHEHLTPELLETQETGMVAREQPLSLIITTAGSLIDGPCYMLELEAKQILEGLLENERFFVAIYGIDDEPYEWNGELVEADDWQSEIALKKANPLFGVSVSAEALKAAQAEAIATPHRQNTFKTKHLNIWVGARSAWMNLEKWRKCGDASMRIEDFAGEDCYEGEDLAAKIDLASRCKVFTREHHGARHYYVFSRNYVPRDRAQDGKHVHYEKWVHEGWLISHEGPEIQLPLIQREIEADLGRFKFKCLAFDPWSALQMQQDLEKKTAEGTVISIPQTVQYLSPAMKEVEAAVLGGRLHHDGNPVLAWAMANVMVKEDANENIFPRKEANGISKIDPASALFNAINRAMIGAPAATTNEVFFL